MFEEDSLRAVSSEMIEAQSKFRQSIYRDLYGITYKYVVGSNTNTAYIDPELDIEVTSSESVDVFTPAQATKPYIPASIPNEESALPFGKALDAPLR